MSTDLFIFCQDVVFFARLHLSVFPKITSNKFHLRHNMPYEFWKDQKATKAVENINSVYGLGSVKVRLVQYWFHKFHKGNFNLEDGNVSDPLYLWI